ncbi:MarR family winged helix-turn-helix transcriptional regulator [Streptomyces sp. NPDC050617]|uniref:MarR family winged helix-turn-helix transcriptional regulator n=1 Tax=Streptomyces sp. NPDC050617 TaxID=3154628 RepID=UPI0034418D2A
MNERDDCPAPMPLVESLPFRLGVLGTLVTDQLVARLKSHDLKPKHVGLMTLLSAKAPASQLELARIMGVAPSLIVTLADHLAELGVVQRERDPDDRRRQLLTLSDRGQDLLTECAMASAALDAELTADLTPDETAALRTGLRKLAARTGAPVADG